MKPLPCLVLSVLVLLPIACQKASFSEDKTAAETYEIKVIDPNAADAEGSIATTVENMGNVDSTDSASAAGSDTGKTGSTDSTPGTDTGKKGSTDSAKTADKGSNKGSDAEGSDCAVSAGISKERVKVSGSQKSLTLAPQEAFALKVTGNTNQVKLNMSSETPGARIAAICLFLAGNQSHVSMDIGVAVDKVFIKARGNKALVEATVSKDGVIKALEVDASGNQPSIVLRGEGRYPCEQVGASVSCVKP